MLRVHFRRWIPLCWSGLLAVLLGALVSLGAPTPLSAQQTENPPTEPAVETPEDLAVKQAQLADKYRRLEDLIFKMADFEATSNPRRRLSWIQKDGSRSPRRCAAVGGAKTMALRSTSWSRVPMESDFMCEGFPQDGLA